MAKKALTNSEINKWNRLNAELIKSDAKLTLQRQVENVTKNIETLSLRKVKATIVLCKYYEARSKELFRKFQIHNVFWTNRTSSAYGNVFSKTITEVGEVGFFIAHAVDYGVYLELANDRKYEALYPIIKELEPEFKKDLKEIWG